MAAAPFVIEPAVAWGLGALGVGVGTAAALKDADLSFPNSVGSTCLNCDANMNSETKPGDDSNAWYPGKYKDKEWYPENNADDNNLYNESSENTSESSPGRRKPDGKASELPVIKKGSKGWKDAVKDIKTGSKESKDYSVESEQDADDLLAEGRPEAAKVKKPTYTDEKYKTGHEHHPDESHTQNASHNDRPHIKWKDWSKGKRNSGGAKGHIFYP